MRPPRPTATGDLGEVAGGIESGSTEASLVAIEGPDLGTRYKLEGTVTIGRGPDVHIDLSEDQTSRLHARVERLPGGGHSIQDLRSRNGTEINGSVAKEEVVELTGGDRLRFGGRTVLLYTRRSSRERRADEARSMQAIGWQGAALARELSPLIGAVRSNLDYLDGESGSLRDEHVGECLRDIELAMKRAMTLLDGVSSLSACLPEKFLPVDVTELVYDVSEHAKASFPSAIDIQLRVEPNLALVGNLAALRGLLRNLCTNAREAMSSGGELKLHAAEASVGQLRGLVLQASGRHTVLTVQDSGHGMDEETRKRAFEPFFTTRRRGPGGGLGLAVVREVARLHRGIVTLESSEAGTRVRVYLPFGPTRKFRTPVSTTDGLRSPYRRSPKSAGRVFVMDGDDVVARAAARVLRRTGYEVTTADDGPSLLTACMGAAPDLVILDWDAPDLDAEELCAEIRSAHPESRILLSSALWDEVPEWADEGTSIVTKPWDSHRLTGAVINALRPSMKIDPPTSTGG